MGGARKARISAGTHNGLHTHPPTAKSWGGRRAGDRCPRRRHSPVWPLACVSCAYQDMGPGAWRGKWIEGESLVVVLRL
jgi:hypothetical protein